jgi:thiol-disulfide isomerase/thioredoxin
MKLTALITVVVACSTSFSGETWIGKSAPELAPGDWINSKPLTLSALRGNVVLLEFWTFGCYNCRNTLPSMKAWYKKFANEKFTIIGVHTHEFEREKKLENVRRQTAGLGVEYPVVTDNKFETWTAYDQRYWPVMYLIRKG